MKIEQNKLFENLDESFRDEWRNMPEYIQEDLTPYRTINVRFRCASDIALFEQLMQQKITEKQKTIWFPYAEPRIASIYRYVDES